MSPVRKNSLQDRDRDLLARFDLGEHSAGDLARVDEILEELPEEQQFRKLLVELVEVEVQEPGLLERREALEALQARLSELDASYAKQSDEVKNSDFASLGNGQQISAPQAPFRHNTLNSPVRKASFSSWSAVVGMAFGAILLVSGWYGAISYLNVRSSQDFSVYSTANGQRSTVTLSDGSVVVLNVGSRLEVPVNYADGNRALRLSGEALFTVVSHNKSPFTVTAGPSTTRVLGTSFIVRKYPSDSAAIIAVREGKVMVQSSVLTAMQQIEVNDRGTSEVQPTLAAQFSFASGVLMFNGVSLPDAILQLNRWYDVDIRLGDSSLMAREVVGGFKEGSLTDLSSILELMLNVDIVRSGKTLTLYPRK